MNGWITGYALVGLAVAVLALREFAPFDSHGERASTGGIGLLMGLAWPLVVTSWLLARAAEVGRNGRWPAPMPSALHSSWAWERGYPSSTQPPTGKPPADPFDCLHEWSEITTHDDPYEEWMCNDCGWRWTGKDLQ